MAKAFMIFAKVFGLVWYWFVVPFRAYSRSVVHSYALDPSNDVRIKRLDERNPEWSELLKGWYLTPLPQHDVKIVHRGFVKYRKVSKLHFWLVVFLLWGWVDDDSNHDTFDTGHNDRYLSGDLKWHPMTLLFRFELEEANRKATYGNAFDIGDYRADYPNFSIPAALIWNTRNTAYNFNYLLLNI